MFQTNITSIKSFYFVRPMMVVIGLNELETTYQYHKFDINNIAQFTSLILNKILNYEVKHFN